MLRFLRGGCGGDCLCGRLCEPCRGPRGPEFYRGVVDRVLPEQVVLRDGRVFRRPGGSAPRPGQDVLVDDRPGLIVQTPQHQPRGGETLPPAFVPLPPSYDTPQRPGAWGAGAIPSVAPEPPRPPRLLTHESVGATATLPVPKDFFPRAYQRADGMNLPLPDAPTRLRAAQGALTVSIVRRTLYPAPFAYALDPYGQAGVYHPRGDIQATPESLSPFGELPGIPVPEPGASVPLQLPAIRYRTTRDEAGRLVLSAWHPLLPRHLLLVTGQQWDAFDAIGARWQERLVGGGWPVLPSQGEEAVIERRGPITRGWLREEDGAQNPMGDVRELQVYREERPLSEGGARYWTIGRQREVLESGEVPQTPVPESDLWQSGVVLQIRQTGDPYPWGLYTCTWLNSMPRETQPEPPLPWTDRTWQTSGQEVVWLADDGGKLTAYGHTLSGGTWTGISPPEGSPEGRALILHEQGDTVTGIWPDGRREECSRKDFEAKVLKCEPGAFRQFSPVGLGANAWPPQWGWAVTGDDEARAVILWDAWRDLTTREWPARPRSRPKRPKPPALPKPLGPPARLLPPLGVTLATTGRIPVYEEPLKIIEGKQQPPWHVPATVERWAGGTWVADPAALAALAKPPLSPPAEQLEALNDRTSVRGLLRVTWAGEALPSGDTGHDMQAALLLRLKVGGAPPTLTVEGAPVLLRPLGRSAGARGWQPYLATWGAPYGTVREASLILRCSAPLSRLLLARIGLGERASGNDS
ncbi:hypothetical protein [Deinococcus wulumuqiensis]|uniref:hypothetical protein n=1 Tax=Deinococcus wulumuqiensis TaxID=980427 RepID=UPI001267E5B7|nr:hypothetical protein [Deinococcus wulumuqiensis]QII20176.1 hypothetical protein G6R31_04885 [Deinococcus wulumuqiensis R12]